MATKTSKLKTTLNRLEKQYGSLVPTDDPVEAGVMTLLAEHAPEYSTPDHRDSLRDWFVDWNEARVADTWDIARAMGAKGAPEGRKFAAAMLRFLNSLHGVLNSCRFDRALRDPEADIEALIGKMRGAPPAARAVMLATLDPEDGWHPGREMSKVAQKLGLAPKTTSLAKVARALAGKADPSDRLRAHYLLTRYALRGAEDPDPLGSSRKRARKTAKKPASKKTASKKTAAKKTTRKTAAKKTAAKKPARKTAAKKKTARKR